MQQSCFQCPSTVLPPEFSQIQARDSTDFNINESLRNSDYGTFRPYLLPRLAIIHYTTYYYCM